MTRKDVDSKHCPDCDAKLTKKIMKWPQVFEAYWCKACKMDFFIEDVTIIPRKSIFIGYDKKGNPMFRVVRVFQSNYNPPKLRRKDVV